jgi:hypothetical protein
MNTNRDLLAQAPMFNASGTFGPGRANQQSTGGEPIRNSQENDHSGGQGNAMQYQWSYEDNDHLNRETGEIPNIEIECFDDKNGKKTSKDAEASEIGNPKGSETGDSEEQRQHENQERQQGLHPNITVRNTQAYSLQTPRHLIKVL